MSEKGMNGHDRSSDGREDPRKTLKGTITDRAEINKLFSLKANNIWDVSKDDLMDHFKDYQPVADIHIPWKEDQFTPEGKAILRGFAFVRWRDKDLAEKALSEINDKKLNGKAVSLQWIEEYPNRPKGGHFKDRGAYKYPPRDKVYHKSGYNRDYGRDFVGREQSYGGRRPSYGPRDYERPYPEYTPRDGYKTRGYQGERRFSDYRGGPPDYYQPKRKYAEHQYERGYYPDEGHPSSYGPSPGPGPVGYESRGPRKFQSGPPGPGPDYADYHERPRRVDAGFETGKRRRYDNNFQARDERPNRDFKTSGDRYTTRKSRFGEPKASYNQNPSVSEKPASGSGRY